MAEPLAARFRRAREAMELGMQLGCTPAEAVKRARRQRHQAALERLDARMAERMSAPRQIDDERWMMRN